MNKLTLVLLIGGLLSAVGYIIWDKADIIPDGYISGPNKPDKPKPCGSLTTTTTITKPGGEVVTTIVQKVDKVVRPNLKLLVGVEYPEAYRGSLEAPVYALGVMWMPIERFWIGPEVKTDKSIGLKLGIEF